MRARSGGGPRREAARFAVKELGLCAKRLTALQARRRLDRHRKSSGMIASDRIRVGWCSSAGPLSSANRSSCGMIPLFTPHGEGHDSAGKEPSPPDSMVLAAVRWTSRTAEIGWLLRRRGGVSPAAICPCCIAFEWCAGGERLPAGIPSRPCLWAGLRPTCRSLNCSSQVRRDDSNPCPALPPPSDILLSPSLLTTSPSSRGRSP